MKNKELKSDAVAKRIVGLFGYIIKNKLIFVVLLSLVSIGIYYLIPPSEDLIEDRISGDELLLGYLNSQQNSDSTLRVSGIDNYNDKSTKLNLNYETNRLLKLSTKNDSLFRDIYNSLSEEDITNSWFKTVYKLRMGDIYSDEGNLNKAKSFYQSAITYSQSDAYEGYSHYKLGNVYFELEDFNNALLSFKKADKLFNTSKDNGLLASNQKFSNWIDRNKIALAKVKNILKK